MPLYNPATDFTKQALPTYLTEGPAWENDKVAFRLYLDVRNNKDIYGKTTSRMVLDDVGVDPKLSYHALADWGMDVLHVVKSLGAGALALQYTLDGKDTLMRLGGSNVTQTIYQQLADGPVRAMLRLSYKCLIDNKPFTIQEEISIWGGQYFYESKITVNGAPPNTKLVTGIADFYENTAQNFSEGECQILFSHGKQSENKDYLGLGIIVPKTYFAKVGVAVHANAEVLDTYTISQNIQNGDPCRFRFYVGWEKTDRQFATQWNFKKTLSTEAEKWTRPVQVK